MVGRPGDRKAPTPPPEHECKPPPPPAPPRAVGDPVDPEKLWEAFTSDWERREESVRGTSTAGGYHIIRFLVEILKELQTHRPVELEPVPATIESYESRFPLMAYNGLTRVLFRQIDDEVQRRMAEVHSPPNVSKPIITKVTGQDQRWWLQCLVLEAEHKGVHPAAAELARRILAGQGPTVTVYHRVALMVQRDDPMTPADMVDLEWCDVLDLNGPQTVLVMEPGVDLEHGDLAKEGT